MKLQLSMLLALVWLGASLHAGADTRLATIFQDNMVLQREKPVPVWGWADPGTQVEVDFAGQSKQAKADDKGYWKAVLDPLTANATGQDLTAKIGSTTVTRKNVLIGEVWFTASHSALGSDGPYFDTGFYPPYDFGAGAGKPEIRYCQFGFGASLTPYDDIDPMGRAGTYWKTFNENPASQAMTAVGYFARALRNELNVPVGIVQMILVSATDSPTWCSRETLESFPSNDGHANFYEEVLAKKNAQLADPHLPFHSFDEFKKLEDAWRVSKTGGWPGAGITLNGIPTMGYNTRVYPLHPFAARGVIYWAITGSDHGVAAPLDGAMQKQWRELFGQDLYFLESGSCRYTNDQPPLTPFLSSTWVTDGGETIRAAALLLKDDPKMAPVDQFDTGDWVTHLMDKGQQGLRFAYAALTVAYGKNYIYTGPRMIETKIEGNKATVRFDHVGDGLIYQPSIDGISGVYLLGKDGKSVWGEVNVTGKDTVEFSSPNISELAGVAYAENVSPHETLFNSEGGKAALPASPFTTIPISGGTPPKFRIVSMVGETGWDHVLNNAVVKNAHISLAHLRRSGYVFQIIGQETLDNGMRPIAQTTPDLTTSSASVPVMAYIPAEWKGYEVVMGDKYDVRDVGGFTVSKGLVKTGGKPIEATETDKDGAKFVTFNAPVDSTWVIVAETGKAADFAKVNRY
jgi:sialate O-acetylesterase